MTMNFGSWLGLGMVAATMFAGPAGAAPYCVAQQGIPNQCLFFDPGECKLRAQQLGGSCAANTAELPVASASPTFPYCVTGPGYSACKFADRGACEAEAARMGVACVEGTAIATGAPPDPYRDLFVTGR